MEYSYNYTLLGELLDLSGNIQVSVSEKSGEKGELSKAFQEFIETPLDQIISSTLNRRNLSCVGPEMIRDIMRIIALNDEKIDPDGWYKTDQSCLNVIYLEKRSSRTCILLGPEGVFSYDKKQDIKSLPRPLPTSTRNNVFNYLFHRCFIDMKRINKNAFMTKGEENRFFREICERYNLTINLHLPYEFY